MLNRVTALRNGRVIPLLLLLSVLCLAALAAISTTQPTASAERPQSSDTALYKDVAQAIEHGEGYYETVAALHRERNYPLKPFYTVRPPTLALATGFSGTTALYVLASVLLFANISAWFHKLEGYRERPFFLGFIVIAVAPLISVGIYVHEFWAGMLISLALASSFRWQLVLGILAVAVRELALPFMLLIFTFSFVEKRFERAAAVACALGLIAVGLSAHAWAVSMQVVATDEPSQGWFGLIGLGGLLDHLRTLSLLQLFPRPLAALAAFLPVVGWYCLGRTGLFAILWFAGFGFAIATIARPDNLFWAITILPVYFAGITLVPRFITSLYRKAPS